MPCVGTTNRYLICEEILNELVVWRQMYPDHSCIIAGDFNVTLDSNTDVSRLVNDFLLNNNFSRCDIKYPNTCQYTYINESLNQYSKIDYIICNEFFVTDFQVLESPINFSDHLPLLITGQIRSNCTLYRQDKKNDEYNVSHLHWDRGDRNTYYNLTYEMLKPLLDNLIDVCSSNVIVDDINRVVNSVYESLVASLTSCAWQTIPCIKKMHLNSGGRKN